MKRINIHPETFPISIHDSMKVYNLSSPRSGNPVANQFAVRVGTWLVKFQSYNTTCLTCHSGQYTNKYRAKRSR